MIQWECTTVDWIFEYHYMCPHQCDFSCYPWAQMLLTFVVSCLFLILSQKLIITGNPLLVRIKKSQQVSLCILDLKSPEYARESCWHTHVGYGSSAYSTIQTPYTILTNRPKSRSSAFNSRWHYQYPCVLGCFEHILITDHKSGMSVFEWKVSLWGIWIWKPHPNFTK